METLLYTKHGKPWGFIKDDFVYKYPNEFIGWIEDNEVYSKKGEFIGRLLNYMFVVRNKNEPRHSTGILKSNTRIPDKPATKKPLDIIPNETFLWTDEIDCLENL